MPKKGYKQTKEHRINMSKALKGKVSKNHARYWLGKKGENHPRWKGGGAGVHPEILKRFGRNPKEIFDRDNYQCQECGNKDDLTIHHIDRNGRNSKNPNNDIDNLITLCRSCHSRIHGKEKMKGGDNSDNG